MRRHRKEGQIHKTEDTGSPQPPCGLCLTAPGWRHSAGCGSPCSSCRISLGCFRWGLPTSERGPCLKLEHVWHPASTFPFLPWKAMHGEHTLATKNKRTLFLLFILNEKQHGSFIFSSRLINKTILSLRWPSRESLTRAPSVPHNGRGWPLKQCQRGKQQEKPGHHPWVAWRWVAAMNLAWPYSHIGALCTTSAR